MNILSVETSTVSGSIALLQNVHVLAKADLNSGMRHGKELVTAIGRLLETAGIPRQQLDLLVAGLGPGSYTGMRIGVTTVKTLAFAMKKPALGISSMDALPYNLTNGKEGDVVQTVLYGHSGEFYHAVYENKSGAFVRESEIRVISENEIANEILKFGGNIIFDEKLDEVLGVKSNQLNLFSDKDARMPRAEIIGLLGLNEFQRNGANNVHALQPLYLRAFKATFGKNGKK